MAKQKADPQAKPTAKAKPKAQATAKGTAKVKAKAQAAPLHRAVDAAVEAADGQEVQLRHFRRLPVNILYELIYLRRFRQLFCARCCTYLSQMPETFRACGTCGRTICLECCPPHLEVSCTHNALI